MNMQNSTNTRSDEELLSLLDVQGLWLVRNGLKMQLATTLYNALRIASDFSVQGTFSGPIVKLPVDEIVIDARQVYNLWQRIGLKIEMETT